MSDSNEKNIPPPLPPPESLKFTELGILPLRNSVFFPGMMIPVTVGRPSSKALIEHARRFDTPIGLVTQRDPQVDEPGADDLYEVGAVARIVKIMRNGDNYNVIVQGLGRFRLEEVIQTRPYMVARASPALPGDAGDIEVNALMKNLKEVAREVVRLMPDLPIEAGMMLESMEDPGQLADIVASNLDITIQDKQDILATVDIKPRLEKVLSRITRQLEILKLSNKIQNQVKDEMDKNQREYILRQQLKAIKEELGESGGGDDELQELEKKIESAGMPEEVLKTARKELSRLQGMRDSSPEYTISRTYLDWLVDIPWKTSTEDNLDLENVRAVLEKDHYGLEKVKKRIIEFLAVRRLKKDMKGPILCLVGPPGVGKTSLGRSIAKALDRKFVRMSLGGVRDEAEIRGHRRTYIGAMPGKIIHAMKKAGTINPVILLDEVDKLGMDFRGDPSSALLEVLDPEQNNTFQDHYLNLPYDLSKVLFIATANMLDPLPPPLVDRMEIIEIPGYTLEEKKHIARRHLLPKQINENGIAEKDITLPDDSIDFLISAYTREAGVRSLERQIAAVCRGVAVDVASGKNTGGVPVDRERVIHILGPERFLDESKERVFQPGIATGMAWTPVGGEVMYIEATQMTGKGGIHLTGKLGDVMKESAHAAFSYLRSHCLELGLQPDFVKDVDVHIHVPAGAIPKDGPSAGVTMLTALASLFTGIKVRDDIAMTGEISLRGLVLPVGGIKEKVLAAHRQGVRTIILPERNKKDLIDIPEETRKEISFHFASHVDEALALALERKPVPAAPLPKGPAPAGAGSGSATPPAN
ncbi:MAG: Lon protease 2 [Myxococcota bacterium]|nr:Lon protease 2 [Myxococcota bacterium]